MDPVDLTRPELYINRELSLIEFNRRVLAQAKDERIPLLERLRFLCIASANLDEFFEIRVAGLGQQAAYGAGGRGARHPAPPKQPRRVCAPPTTSRRQSSCGGSRRLRTSWSRNSIAC
jgi:polyphosphate kinase